MPNLSSRKINETKHEVLVDGEGIAFLIQGDTGLWHLSGVGSDEIEPETTLTNGEIFSGGTIDEAIFAAYDDWMCSGLILPKQS